MRATARKESTATFTNFLRQPKPMLERLRRGDVILRRREGDSIRLSLEPRTAASKAGTEVAASLLAELVARLPAPDEALAGALQSCFPWVKFLPSKERQKFASEFVETVRACASVGSNAALDEMTHAWKSTALVYSDPKLVAALQRPVSASLAVVSRP